MTPAFIKKIPLCQRPSKGATFRGGGGGGGGGGRGATLESAHSHKMRMALEPVYSIRDLVICTVWRGL